MNICVAYQCSKITKIFIGKSFIDQNVRFSVPTHIKIYRDNNVRVMSFAGTNIIIHIAVWRHRSTGFRISNPAFSRHAFRNGQRSFSCFMLYNTGRTRIILIQTFSNHLNFISNGTRHWSHTSSSCHRIILNSKSVKRAIIFLQTFSNGLNFIRLGTHHWRH